jgi:hypothetical protein
MGSHLLRALLLPEIHRMRRLVRVAAWTIAALVLALAAVLVAMASLYLYLAQSLVAWQAASIVSCLLLFSGGIAFLVGKLLRGGRRSEEEELGHLLLNALGGKRETDAEAPTKLSAVDLAVTAALLGILFGKRRD